MNQRNRGNKDVKWFGWLWGACCLFFFAVIVFWDVGTASTWERVLFGGIFFTVLFLGGMFMYWADD